MTDSKKLANNKYIALGQRTISNAHEPFVIAELSGNHGQSLSLAKEMITQAAKAGVDAIKLQTYKAETMTLDCEQKGFVIEEQDSLWHGEKLYDLYDKASTPWEWHQELFEYAHSLGLISFSSPFDASAVAFLETLNVPIYKVASFELTDIPLIEAIAKTQKPVIMSTGMASIEEIEQALAALRRFNQAEVVLLKCTSTYPADYRDINLSTLHDMASRFDCLVGLSDHTRGLACAVASVSLGACVIEKHFVLDRSAGGVDAAFSMEPDEMQQLVKEVKNAWQAMGTTHYGGAASEEKAKQYRRSIYVKQPINAGEVFSDQNLQIVRPAFGLAPKHWQDVLGKKAKSDMTIGQPLSWDLIDD